MAYTVKEVAHMSGTSVRTLHHYDEIGLLKPAYYGDNGYRYYEEEQLLQLQQILFFRELEMPLEDIRRTLESSRFDRMRALDSHKRLLQIKAERLSRLLLTVDRTIEHLKGDIPMRDPQFFEGFDKERAEQVKKELQEFYGDKRIDDTPFEMSLERTKGWGKADYNEVKKDYDTIHKAITAVMASGADPSSDGTQVEIRKHYEVITRFYDPTKEMYEGLGQLYVDHPEFRKLYDSYHPQLAEYMRDAMKVFAERNL